MKEKYLSSQYTLTLKYSFFICLTISFIIGVVLLIKNFEPKEALMLIVIGLMTSLAFSRLRNLREVSYTDKQIVIKNFTQKKYIDIQEIKKIYRIDIVMFYRIEFLENGKKEYVDIWTSSSFFKMVNGKLPPNLQEFLNLIKQ